MISSQVSLSPPASGTARHGTVRSNSLLYFGGLIAANGLMIAAFVMWGGLFNLNTIDTPKFAGLLPLQDILAGISSLLLVLVLVAKARLRRSIAIMAGAVLCLFIFGSLVGILNGNRLINVAAEARPFLYMTAGAVLLLTLKVPTVDKLIRFYAVLMSAAILLQFVLLIITGDRFIFFSEVHLGNQFTLSLPFVRPQAFHLVLCGFILAILQRGPARFSLATWVMLAALLVAQSKTQWLLIAAVVVLGFLAARTVATKSKLVLIGSAGLIMLGAVMIPLNIAGQEKSVAGFVYDKFAILFQQQDVADALVGVRLEESRLMLDGLGGSVEAWLLGQGFGYAYRDPNLFFHRANERDLERLSIFGHNYFAWFLLKAGLVGIIIFGLVHFISLSSARIGTFNQKRFAIAAIVLLLSAVTLGSLENPLGGFLYGLLLAAAAQREYFSTPIGGSKRLTNPHLKTEHVR
jgi:hypothetical protein